MQDVNILDQVLLSSVFHYSLIQYLKSIFIDLQKYLLSKYSSAYFWNILIAIYQFSLALEIISKVIKVIKLEKFVKKCFKQF